MKYILYIILLCFFMSCSDEQGVKDDASDGSVVMWFHTRSSEDIQNNIGNCKLLVFSGKTGDYIKTMDLTTDVMDFPLLFNPESYIFAFIANDNRFSSNSASTADWRYTNYYNATKDGKNPAFQDIVVRDGGKYKEDAVIYFDTVMNVDMRGKKIDTIYVDLAPVQAKFSFSLKSTRPLFLDQTIIYGPSASYLYDKDSVDKLELVEGSQLGEDTGKYVEFDCDNIKETKINENSYEYTYESYNLFENLAGTLADNANFDEFILYGDYTSNANPKKQYLRQQPTYLELSFMYFESGSFITNTKRIYIGGTQDGVLNITDYNVRRGYHYHYDIDCRALTTRSGGEDNLSFSVTSRVEKL